MRKFSTMLFCAAAVAVFATAAFGDDGLDPTLWQNGQGCNASSTPPVATYWCAGTAFAAAPGQTSKTLEFLLNTVTTVGPSSTGITLFSAAQQGWVEYETGGTVDDYMDITVVGGQDAIFLYCNVDCGPNDAVLPTAPAVSVIIPWASPALFPAAGSVSPAYTPASSTSPGWGTAYYQGTPLPGTNPPPVYGILNNYIATPEPSAALLLGVFLLAMTGVLRRYVRQ